MSIVQNAGTVAFSDFYKGKLLRRSCVSSAWNAAKVCVSWLPSATLCGYCACSSCGMLPKLRFLISKCNPLRRSCVSIARNEGKVLRFCNLEGDLLQVVLYRILMQRSWRGRLAQEILMCYRILKQRSWHGHIAQGVLIQRSCAKGPTNSWQRSWHRSCASGSREILRKWSHRFLTQRSSERDLAQEIRIQSCTAACLCTCCFAVIYLASTTKKTPKHCLGSLAGIILFSCWFRNLHKISMFLWLRSFTRKGPFPQKGSLTSLSLLKISLRWWILSQKLAIEMS